MIAPSSWIPHPIVPMHRKRDWTPYATVVGMLGLGFAVGWTGMTLAGIGGAIAGTIVGTIVGDVLGRALATRHLRLQETALAAFDAQFPFEEAFHTALETARTGLRHSKLPLDTCTILALWTSDTGGHTLTMLAVFGKDSGQPYVEFDVVGPGHGAGGSPILPLEHAPRTWGAKPRMNRGFQATLPLGSAHARLACTVWLAEPSSTGQPEHAPTPQDPQNTSAHAASGQAL